MVDFIAVMGGDLIEFVELLQWIVGLMIFWFAVRLIFPGLGSGGGFNSGGSGGGGDGGGRRRRWDSSEGGPDLWDTLTLKGWRDRRRARRAARGNQPNPTPPATPGPAHGPAVQIVFLTQPSNAQVGRAISPAIQVQFRDANGAVVTSATDTVTLSIGNNPGGSALRVSVNAVSGVATFNTVHLNNPGSGYTLIARTSNRLSATSISFDVTTTTPPPPGQNPPPANPPPGSPPGGPSPPTQLAFSIQPSDAQVGVDIAPPIEVQVQDASGSVVHTPNTMLLLSIANNPSGGNISGPIAAPVVSGIATFNNISIDRAGAGYTLEASHTGLGLNITSLPFDITLQAPSPTPRPAILTPAPSTPFDFGSIPLGTSAPTHTIVVTNTGRTQADRIICRLRRVNGPRSFQISRNYPRSLAVGAHFTIDVDFSPGNVGLSEYVLDIEYFDGSAQQTVSIDLQGTGTPPGSAPAPGGTPPVPGTGGSGSSSSSSSSRWSRWWQNHRQRQFWNNVRKGKRQTSRGSRYMKRKSNKAKKQLNKLGNTP